MLVSWAPSNPPNVNTRLKVLIPLLESLLVRRSGKQDSLAPSLDILALELCSMLGLFHEVDRQDWAGFLKNLTRVTGVQNSVL